MIQFPTLNTYLIILFISILIHFDILPYYIFKYSLCNRSKLSSMLFKITCVKCVVICSLQHITLVMCCKFKLSSMLFKSVCNSLVMYFASQNNVYINMHLLLLNTYHILFTDSTYIGIHRFHRFHL